MSTKQRRKKSGKYRKKLSSTRSKGILHGLSQPKKEIGNSILLTITQMILAGGVGGALGSAIGRHSLLPGMAIAGVGNYIGNPFVTSLGMGVGLANGFQTLNATDKKAEGVSGWADEELEGLSLEEAKSRGMNYFKNFAQKLYLDKVLPPSLPAQGVNGLGEVNYFIYPHDSKSTSTPLPTDGLLSQMNEAELDTFIREQEDILKANNIPLNGLDALEYKDVEGRII